LARILLSPNCLEKLFLQPDDSQGSTMKKLLKAIAVAALAGAAYLPSAHAVPVGLELVLLVDVSGSVNTTEYGLQKTGYVNAFNSAAVQNAIFGSQSGAIAVTYVEWSGNNQQSQLVGWSLINSIASAQAFASAINGTNRAYNGSTAIQDAMMFGSTLFGNNGYEGLRLVMDVSGDGADNDTSDCNTSANARCGSDAAVAAGVNAINGLPILGETGLLTYYQNNVQSGVGSFTLAANGFADFSSAVERKLVAEITNQTPEPGSLALVGLALASLFGLRRKRNS
jgi:hypothetical protein